MKNLEPLIHKLNYRFNKHELMEAALTHRSVRGNNNERLEFLGDSIINFIIAEILFHQYPKAKEGELSRLRSSLVKGETLAILAQEFELNKYLRLGAGEIKSGGAQRESILADAMEAIIGAIYLDGGYDVCKDLVLQWYASRLSQVNPSKVLKDPKTQLQEFLQAKKLPLPRYEIISVEGEAHAQTFHITCQVPGVDAIAEGVGKNRRKAEQEAAKKLLGMIEKT